MQLEKVSNMDGWYKSRLGDVATYINGRAFKPSEWEATGKPIIRIQNLTKSTSTVNYCSKPIDEKFLVKDGDLLISWSATIGAFIYKGEDAVLNQHIFKALPRVNKFYLYYYINFILSRLTSEVHGTGMQHITRVKFDNIPIYLPSLTQQGVIVTKIEELFSRLDAGLMEMDNSLIRLESYKESLLDSAFSGQLSRNYRKSNNESMVPASSLLKNIARDLGKENMVLGLDLTTSQNSPSKKLPVGWESVSLDSIAKINPPFEQGDLSLETEVNFVPMKCVSEITGEVDLSNIRTIKEVKSGHTNFKNGDIVFAKITPCMENGKIAIIDSLKSGTGFGTTEFHVIRLHSVLPRLYYFYFFIRKDFRKKAEASMTGTAGQMRVPSEFMRKVVIPIPPLDEQYEIVELLNSALKSITKLRKTLLDNIFAAKSLRQSILRRAFDGKLVPPSLSDGDQGEAIVMIDQDKYENSDNDAKKQWRLF